MWLSEAKVRAEVASSAGPMVPNGLDGEWGSNIIVRRFWDGQQAIIGQIHMRCGIEFTLFMAVGAYCQDAVTIPSPAVHVPPTSQGPYFTCSACTSSPSRIVPCSCQGGLSGAFSGIQ